MAFDRNKQEVKMTLTQRQLNIIDSHFTAFGRHARVGCLADYDADNPNQCFTEKSGTVYLYVKDGNSPQSYVVSLGRFEDKNSAKELVMNILYTKIVDEYGENARYDDDDAYFTEYLTNAIHVDRRIQFARRQAINDLVDVMRNRLFTDEFYKEQNSEYTEEVERIRQILKQMDERESYLDSLGYTKNTQDK